MRAKQQVRPALESLESMTLLSGVAAMHAHVPAAEVAPMPGVISLQGRIQGFYLAHQNNPDTGKVINVFAVGRINPLGESAVNGTLNTPGFIMSNTVTGNMTVRSRFGSLNLQLTGVESPTSPTSTPSNMELTYTIKSGTGQLQGDTGTGVIDVSLHSFGSAFSRFRGGGFGRVTFNFHPAPTPVV